MFKFLIYGLIAVAAVSIISGSVHLIRTAQKNKKDMAPYEGREIAVDNNFGKVLVVYYSLSGNTKDIAQRIQEKTNADVFEIKTAEPIVSGPAFYWNSRKQLKSGKYPEINGNLPDFSKYDIVFVGFPVWWYSVATPVLAFLEQADFKNKTVIPFSTQGSNVGSSFEDFKNKARNANVLSGASFNNLPDKYSKAVDNKISAWLNSIKK